MRTFEEAQLLLSIEPQRLLAEIAKKRDSHNQTPASQKRTAAFRTMQISEAIEREDCS